MYNNLAYKKQLYLKKFSHLTTINITVNIY